MKKTNENAITLVALVITITIIVILSAISIMAVSNTGIFGRTKNARTINKIKSAEEHLKMKLSEVQIENKGPVTRNQFINNLIPDSAYLVSLDEEQEFILNSIDYLNEVTEATYVYVEYDDVEFSVDKNLNITYVGFTKGNNNSDQSSSINSSSYLASNIPDFNISILEDEGFKIKVKANVSDDSIGWYALKLNNKVVNILNTDTIEAETTSNTTYDISMIAITKDFTFKESAILNYKTASTTYIVIGGRISSGSNSCYETANYDTNIITNNTINYTVEAEGVTYGPYSFDYNSEGQSVNIQAFTDIRCQVYNDRITARSYYGYWRDIFITMWL